MTEQSQKLTVADAVKEQERTVRRLTARVLRYCEQVSSDAAKVRKVVEGGHVRSLNDLGELQAAGAGLDAAVAALYTAQEALDLLRTLKAAQS